MASSIVSKSRFQRDLLMLLTFVAFLGLSLAFFGLGQSLWWGLARVMGLPPGQPLWGELGVLGLVGREARRSGLAVLRRWQALLAFRHRDVGAT